MLVAVACTGLFLSAPAVCGEDSGWYAGAQLGTTSSDDFVGANDDGSLSMLSTDDSDTSYRVFGGYNFNPFVGVEAGYEDHGETSFTAESDGTGGSWEAGSVGTLFAADSWFAAVVGRWPLGDRWALFGRVGIASWETTETWTEPGGVSSETDSGSDVTYGAGVEYDIGESDSWVLKAEYGTSKVDNDGNSLNALQVGAVFNF